MAFYVAVGPRLFLFRAGMLLTGVMGSLTYWWACRSAPRSPAALFLARGTGGRSRSLRFAADRSRADFLPVGP